MSEIKKYYNGEIFLSSDDQQYADVYRGVVSVAIYGIPNGAKALNHYDFH